MRRRDLISKLCVVALGSRRPHAFSLLSAESPATTSNVPSAQLPSPVAGIRMVDSHTARTATELARSASPLYLFHHAVRTFLFASLVGRARKLKFDEEVLYLACILHDLGLTDQFQGDLPFEIQGAQAARNFLAVQGYENSKADVVWDGIAMHASIIGQYKPPEVALVGAGAGADVLGPDPSEINQSDKQDVINAYPRLGFKKAFLETCAGVVRKHPDGAGRSFMRDIAERYVVNYHRRNFCDLISQAPFED